MVNKETPIDKPKIFEDFEKLITEVLDIRKTPLLLMFYSDQAGRITPDDINALEEVFEDFLHKKGKAGFERLDLVIHTIGGHADTSYRLIQLIRSYCKFLTVLVPTHAYSGGTLITFGANKILMGRTATLSPIDVQLSTQEETRVLPLLSIQKYTEFLKGCLNTYDIKEESNRITFLTELTKSLINEVSPTQLGELFRLTSLTELHAKTLLHNYMFANISEKTEFSKKIVSKFTKDSPTHSFEMEFELVKESGLIVEPLEQNLYKALRNIIELCIILKRSGAICRFYYGSHTIREPFFHIYDMEKEVKQNEKK